MKGCNDSDRVCGDPCRERLKAWLDGELDGRLARRVEAHVGACGDCAAAVVDLETIAARLRSLAADVPAAAELAQETLRLVRDERSQVRFLQRVAAVAAAVLVVTLAALVWSHSGSNGAAPPEGEARDSVLYLVISDPAWEEEIR